MTTTSDARVEVLRALPLFNGINERRLRRAAELMQPWSFHDGELVMLEGYHGEQFLLIVSGNAEVTRHDEHVATLGPGDFLGEIGLIDDADRNATVRAVGRLKTLNLDADQFARLRQSLPEVAAPIDAKARERHQ